MPSWVFHGQSMAIFALLLYGAYRHKDRSFHVKMMVGAVVWDFFLIGQIELGRMALAKASSFLSNPLLLNLHLGLAIVCVLGYMALMITGWKLLKGKVALWPWHRRLGLSVLFVRALVLGTSFWAVEGVG